MHTGPLSMRLPFDGDDNDHAPRATFWSADEVIACPADDSPGADDLTAREAFELACWAARLDGDPSADRCAS